MGRAKASMMENEDNNGLIEFLEELIEREELSGAANGIAKQVIDQGEQSMSPKQKAVIDKIVNNYKKYECELCLNGNVSKLTDYLFIAENKLCPMCKYDKEKFMKE